MRPKVFIGSSVESLPIASAIQQNLYHYAEATPWNQGTFDLSKTTIESLVKTLDNVDFAIFVFSPDDNLKIKEKEVTATRDNVVFELGLFIGKLGRDRVFFAIPSHNPPHIPTDLLGITPGTYDSKRSDNNLEAATGPLCTRIQKQLQLLGPIVIPEESSDKPILVDEEKPKSDWFKDFVDRKYEDAISKIDSELGQELDIKDYIKLRCFKALLLFLSNPNGGFKPFDELHLEYLNEKYFYWAASLILKHEGYVEKAISLLQDGLRLMPNDSMMIKQLAQCYIRYDDHEEAIKIITDRNYLEDADLGLTLCSIYEKLKDYANAKIVVDSLYKKFPNHEDVLLKYATVADLLNEDDIAAFLLHRLIELNPKQYNYYGLLSNACLNLDMYDRALYYAQKAHSIDESKSWVIANMGNILKNKGLYTESIKYFEQSLSLEVESDYTHDRLSSSFKMRDEEIISLNKALKDGRRKIREFNAKVIED